MRGIVSAVIRAGERVFDAQSRGLRVIEITPEVLDDLVAAANTPERRVTVEWPEPDADGFTTPLFHSFTVAIA